jgi:dTDP-4-amino-4,6-dideoxygalactose transaminase
LNVPLADLRAQYHELKEPIDAAIAEVIESGQYVGGPKVQQLEAAIAALCGAQFGIGVASGTDALTLSLVACGVGEGDEVITTPFTFAATTEAIALVGARAVYADIDACTYNLDPERVAEKITPRAKAILPVDLYGQMADRAAFQDLARRHNLRLIFDSAQSIGAQQNGWPIAAHGDTTTLSFYPTKNLGAFGDGGMVLTNDAQLAERLRSLRGHGTGKHKYYHERIGYCSRLDAIQAAALLVKLPRLPLWNEGRRRNAERYQALLSDLTEAGLILPRQEAGNCHIYHQYTVRHARRNALQNYLKENDIATEIYYPHPLHLQPAYAYLGYRKGDFPQAERAAREVLSLPIHPELTEAQIHYVATHLRQFLAQTPPARVSASRLAVAARGQ